MNKKLLRKTEQTPRFIQSKQANAVAAGCARRQLWPTEQATAAAAGCVRRLTYCIKNTNKYFINLNILTSSNLNC